MVTGPPTAGKSTFADELVCRHAIQHICIDPIIEAFEDVYPELGITHRAGTLEAHTEVCARFEPFVSRMLEGLRDDEFVLEGYRLPLESLVARFPELRFVVFGYPTSTPDARVLACRQHDQLNWTNEMTDGELRGWFEFFVAESVRLEGLCARLGVPFYDTGLDYWPVLRRALADLAA